LSSQGVKVGLGVLLVPKHVGIEHDNLSSRGVKMGPNTLLGHKDTRILGDSLSSRGVKWVRECCWTQTHWAQVY